MKIENIEDSILITAKKLSFFERSIVRSLLQYIILIVLLFIIFTFKNFNINTKVLYLVIIGFTTIFISTFILYSNKSYYVWLLKITSNLSIAEYFINTKKYRRTFEIIKVSIKKNERVVYRGKVDIIEISENNKIILEIWPDFAYIGKQWKQEDIYELYDILIVYQNKLKEKQTSEQEKT